MHVALRTPEILREIFVSQLAVPLPDFSDGLALDTGDLQAFRSALATPPGVNDVREIRANLLMAALTCRTFSGPALDGLWRYVDSLVPLLSCLSTFQFDKETCTYKIVSDIPDEDFGGFYAYARRIRWLRPSRDSPSIDVSVYTSLWSKIDGCLLPGLQIFDLSAAPDYPRVAPSSVLLSESLHTVDISAYRRMSPGTIKNLEYYFSCMVTESPSVQKLRVSAHFASACLSHLSGLHNLQVLEFQKELIYSAQGQGDATKEAMLALSGLRSLVTLRMDVQGETFEMETLAMHDLPCLEVVELNGILDPMVSILRHLPKHRIHSLRFDVLCRAESDPIQNVAVDHHCLFKQLAFPQLRILKFYSEVGGGDDELPVQTGELLSEALRCRHLETLDVNFVCAQVATDDEDIRNMALAWPKIQRVKYVQCEETMHPAGLPTIFALEHFAQHCPDLTILDVILNADVDYYPADITPYTHGLKRLLLNEIEVWLLRHECWRHLARYLDSLFPNLEILDEDDTGDNWAQMFQNIDILQQVRRDQDLRWMQRLHLDA